MGSSVHHIQHGQFRYKDKIYFWMHTSQTGKLIVKNAGEDIFTVKPYLESDREKITNDYVIDKVEKFLKFGTPTPELDKSEPFDGVDFVPED
jgi:hypothetical protein